MRLGELEGVVGEEGGYTAEADGPRFSSTGSTFLPSSTNARWASLQGGQKVSRASRAGALRKSDRAFYFDEPTNYLDLDSVHWLQDYLTAYEGILIVISHDRHFLNEVCTHIADIDYESVITYSGGYDDMVLAKTSVRARIDRKTSSARRKSRNSRNLSHVFPQVRVPRKPRRAKKKSSACKRTELAKSNIQRPFIKFELKQTVGPSPARI